MINCISKIFRQKEAGFTLIEVLVSVVLVGIIAIGASAGIHHLLGANSTNANAVTVTTNINSATDSLVPDVQMSEIKIELSENEEEPDLIMGIGQAAGGATEWQRTTDPETGNYIITGMGAVEGETKWLCLTWTWDDGDHLVTYEFQDGKLFRTHKIYTRTYDSEGILTSETLTSETSTMVAQYFDAGATNWKLLYDKESGEATVEITISSSISGYKSVSESRTIQVVPRVQIPPANS